MPTISVVLPVYNGARFLRSSIESILQQTFSDFEFFIIDDGSTDESRVIIQSYKDTRIQPFENHQNIGITESLNKGISAARGKYIARMDADDVSLFNRFEKQVGFLERHPEVAMVGANCTLIDGRGNTLGQENYFSSAAEIMKQIFVHNPFAHSAVMMRADAIKECGMYDRRYLHNEDYDLWLRIASRHSVANLEEVLLLRRVHESSVTAANETEVAAYRVKTLFHAVIHYYGKPSYLIFVVRPVFAFLYRLVKGLYRR